MALPLTQRHTAVYMAAPALARISPAGGGADGDAPLLVWLYSEHGPPCACMLRLACRPVPSCAVCACPRPSQFLHAIADELCGRTVDFSALFVLKPAASAEAAVALGDVTTTYKQLLSACVAQGFTPAQVGRV